MPIGARDEGDGAGRYESPVAKARSAEVAQLVEQPPCKRQVRGSSPLFGLPRSPMDMAICSLASSRAAGAGCIHIRCGSIPALSGTVRETVREAPRGGWGHRGRGGSWARNAARPGARGRAHERFNRDGGFRPGHARREGECIPGESPQMGGSRQASLGRQRRRLCKLPLLGTGALTLEAPRSRRGHGSLETCLHSTASRASLPFSEAALLAAGAFPSGR